VFSERVHYNNLMETLVPNVITNKRIISGTKRVIQYISIDSDGTEETDLVVYDSSAVATEIGKVDSLMCTILSITYSTSSVLGINKLEWDGTTDVLAWSLPLAAGTGIFDFTKFGGLKNTAGAGITGDVLFTTTGLVAGDVVSLIIELMPY